MIDFDTAILDMDGTLIDSLSVWEQIDRDFLEKRRGISVPEDYVDAIAAMSFYETAVYTKQRFNLPDSPQQLMDEWREMSIYEYSHNIKLKKDVRPFLEKLKGEGKKLVLCTSSPNFLYEPVLKNNGIYELFDAFANTCEAGMGKGCPDVYLLAAGKVNAKPERCLVFEDVLEAAQSAVLAGMHVCGVYDERSQCFMEKMKQICDIYIESFTQLL